MPTSSDVHLFPDYSTATHERPRLYVDSEGLNGGNIAPVMAQKRLKRRKRDRVPGAKRLKIPWLCDEMKTRSWIVKNFYPRVLFTFSDAVVYVTKNFRQVPTPKGFHCRH
jgi:hypothetical protein